MQLGGFLQPAGGFFEGEFLFLRSISHSLLLAPSRVPWGCLEVVWGSLRQHPMLGIPSEG